jgi:dynactin-4
MLVSYTYRSDDPVPEDDDVAGTPSRGGTTKAPEMKTFSFSIVVDLGSIIPKEEASAEMDTS